MHKGCRRRKSDCPNPSGESGVWYFTLKISKIRKVSTASKMKHVTTFYSLYKFLFLLFYACVRCTKFTNVWREVIIIINNFSIVDQWKIIYSRKLDRIVAILRYDYTHIRYEQPRIQPALSFLFFFFVSFPLSIIDSVIRLLCGSINSFVYYTYKN